MINFQTTDEGIASVIAAASRSETRRGIKKGLRGPAKHKRPKFFTIVPLALPAKNASGDKAKFGTVVYYVMSDGLIHPLPPKPRFGSVSARPDSSKMTSMGVEIPYVKPDKAEEMMSKHNSRKSET